MSAPKHIGKRMFPKTELEKKVAFMYERISSEKAKAIARPFYEAALKSLDEMA